MNIAVQVLCSDDPLTEIPVQVQLCVSPKRSQDIYIPNWKTTEDWELQVENHWRLGTPSGKPVKTGNSKWKTTEDWQSSCCECMLTHQSSWGKNGYWWTSSALHAFCLPPQGDLRDNDKQGHWFDFNPAYSFIWDNDKKVTTVTCNPFAMSHHCRLQPVCNVSLRSLPTCLQCLTTVTCNLFAMSHLGLF